MNESPKELLKEKRIAQIKFLLLLFPDIIRLDYHPFLDWFVVYKVNGEWTQCFKNNPFEDLNFVAQLEKAAEVDKPGKLRRKYLSHLLTNDVFSSAEERINALISTFDTRQ